MAKARTLAVCVHNLVCNGTYHNTYVHNGPLILCRHTLLAGHYYGVCLYSTCRDDATTKWRNRDLHI